MRYKAEMLHRDISLSNLMYEIRGGSIWLILNDFDLAARVDKDGVPLQTSSTKHRTGTLPFMAVDILQNLTTAIHYLRHDLESAFWVALWCLIKFPCSDDPEIEKAKRKALLPLEEGNLDQITRTKYMIITNLQEFQQLELTLEMQEYEQWIRGFRYVIREGYLLVQREEEDIASRASEAKAEARRTKGHLQPKIQARFQGDETLGKVVTCEKIADKLKAWQEQHLGEELIPYDFDW